MGLRSGQSDQFKQMDMYRPDLSQVDDPAAAHALRILYDDIDQLRGHTLKVKKKARNIPSLAVPVANPFTPTPTPAPAPASGEVDWIFAYSVEIPFGNLNHNVMLTANNKVAAIEWVLPFDFEVSQLVFATDNVVFANKVFSMGLYDSDLNLVVNSGVQNMVGFTTYNITLASPVLLAAGNYWLAETADTNFYDTVTIEQTVIQENTLNLNKSRFCEATNSSVGGALPSSLSALVLAPYQNVPLMLMEAA